MLKLDYEIFCSRTDMKSVLYERFSDLFYRKNNKEEGGWCVMVQQANSPTCGANIPYGCQLTSQLLYS